MAGPNREEGVTHEGGDAPSRTAGRTSLGRFLGHSPPGGMIDQHGHGWPPFKVTAITEDFVDNPV